MSKIRYIIVLVVCWVFMSSMVSAKPAIEGTVSDVNWFSSSITVAEQQKFTITLTTDKPITTDCFMVNYDDKNNRLTVSASGVQLPVNRCGDYQINGALVDWLSLANDGGLAMTIGTELPCQAKIIALGNDSKQIAVVVSALPINYGYNRLGISTAVAKHKIVMDPGHGGSDRGATGPSGLQEADANFAVCQQVADLLKASGAEVKMTRSADVDVFGVDASNADELGARVEVANSWPADIFVSVHCDAFRNGNANGLGTFYCAKQREDIILANSLCDAIDEELGLKNRGGKEARFYVLRHTDMPAALVEMAFISNAHEEQLLADKIYQQKFALAIARGIADYFALENR